MLLLIKQKDKGGEKLGETLRYLMWVRGSRVVLATHMGNISVGLDLTGWEDIIVVLQT